MAEVSGLLEIEVTGKNSRNIDLEKIKRRIPRRVIKDIAHTNAFLNIIASSSSKFTILNRLTRQYVQLKEVVKPKPGYRSTENMAWLRKIENALSYRKVQRNNVTHRGMHYSKRNFPNPHVFLNKLIRTAAHHIAKVIVNNFANPHADNAEFVEHIPWHEMVKCQALHGVNGYCHEMAAAIPLYIAEHVTHTEFLF